MEISNTDLFKCTLLQSPLISYELFLHVIEIMEASPTSRFSYKLVEQEPNFNVYLVESNEIEAIAICHLFSCDSLESNYSYQSITLDQVRSLTALLDELVLI